jgi:hypothetical protein
MHHDTPDPSAESLRALRQRLRARLDQESAVLDRSWRFALLRHAIRGRRYGIAAVGLLAIGLAGYAARRDPGARPPAMVRTAPEPGALPIRALTPGATERITTADLCAGRGPSKIEIAPAVRDAVLRDYGMAGLADADYELDYLITPELGGSSDRRNLWPERYGSRVWNARVKDELEELLPALVCRGAVGLATAQTDIASDWIAAYKKYFHTEAPLPRQLAARDGLDDHLPQLAAPMARLTGRLR